jgi:response regulator NasT
MRSSVGPESKVLVVVEKSDHLESLVAALSDARFEIRSARAADEAIAALVSCRHDLVVLDYSLPESGGRRVASACQELGQPFIVIADGEAAAIDAAIADGALAFHASSTAPDRLVPSIRVAIARARERLALQARSDQLEEGLRASRAVSIAVGIAMEQHGLDAAEAFERLRSDARRERRKLAELAAEMIARPAGAAGGAARTSARRDPADV